MPPRASPLCSGAVRRRRRPKAPAAPITGDLADFGIEAGVVLCRRPTPEHQRLGRCSLHQVRSLSRTPKLGTTNPCQRRCPWCHARRRPVHGPVTCLYASAARCHLQSGGEDLLQQQHTVKAHTPYTVTDKGEYTLLPSFSVTQRTLRGPCMRRDRS